MNFYRRFPGDYARDTKHLTLAEHGAYTLLLDYYYATEKPIPSLEFAYALCNSHRAESRRAVKNVLRAFFKKEDSARGGYVNKRAEEELRHLESRRESAKRSANARWNESERNANASETHNERNAIQTPDSRLQTSDAQDQAAAVRFKEIWAAAAFSAIGFDKPFGNVAFQRAFVREFEKPAEWLTMKLEATIQRCQADGIGIPPQFYEAKRDVEKREMPAAKKAPL